MGIYCPDALIGFRQIRLSVRCLHRRGGPEIHFYLFIERLRFLVSDPCKQIKAKGIALGQETAKEMASLERDREAERSRSATKMNGTSATMIPLEPRSESLFHKLFVRYGAGSDVFSRITRSKYWNAIAWTLIVVATIGWTVDLVLWYFFGSAD
ncbi:MAG: hypothetical protein JOY54_09595 [Acidobacteriaceae bacterium]|nr:hypothetical protein [Acidobacteriaceae bacterium]